MSNIFDVDRFTNFSIIAEIMIQQEKKKAGVRRSRVLRGKRRRTHQVAMQKSENTEKEYEKKVSYVYVKQA